MPTYRLTDRLTIQRRTAPLSDFDPEPEKWADVCTAWADIRPLSASEQVNAQQTVGTVTHRVIIRYPYKKLSPDMRAIWRLGVLHIVGITDVDGRGDYTELTVKQERRP